MCIAAQTFGEIDVKMMPANYEALDLLICQFHNSWNQRLIVTIISLTSGHENEN